MRYLVLGAVALALSTPAFAGAETSSVTNDAQEMAQKMNDPRMQSAMVGGLDAMLGALLNIRLDGFAKALEPLNNGKKIHLEGKTVREMAERSDPNFEKKMHGSTRAAVGGMGALATAMATMMPELEKAMQKMSTAMDKVDR